MINFGVRPGSGWGSQMGPQRWHRCRGEPRAALGASWGPLVLL